MVYDYEAQIISYVWAEYEQFHYGVDIITKQELVRMRHHEASTKRRNDKFREVNSFMS